MSLFTIEHGKTAYRIDFAVYGSIVGVLAAVLLVAGPRDRQWEILVATLAGAFGWTFIEYALHRFVLHGLPPFSRWHAEHHDRPTALICAPTILSGTLIAGLVFLPAWLLADLWMACALTLGLLAGYLGYAVMHHATHHWRAGSDWARRRKHWHARHHHASAPGCYGVTTAFWDRVFGSTGRLPVAAHG